MKIFLIWLFLSLAFYGGFGIYWDYKLTANPRQIVILLDASNPMKPDFVEAKNSVRKIISDVPKYVEPLVYTSKGTQISINDKNPKLGDIKPYSKRDFEKFFEKHQSDLKNAKEKILITNISESKIKDQFGKELFATWRINTIKKTE